MFLLTLGVARNCDFVTLYNVCVIKLKYNNFPQIRKKKAKSIFSYQDMGTFTFEGDWSQFSTTFSTIMPMVEEMLNFCPLLVIKDHVHVLIKGIVPVFLQLPETLLARNNLSSFCQYVYIFLIYTFYFLLTSF